MCIKKIIFYSGLLFVIISIMTNCKKDNGKKPIQNGQTPLLKFSGGPSGGMFQFFSNGISIYISKKLDGLKLKNQPSQGSIENIKKIENKQADFAIAYSGDVFLARKGELENDSQKYNNIRAMSFLYKAPAQLAVLKDSGIKKVLDLKGRKLDIGGSNSGAASSAERFLKTVGLWHDNTIRSNYGYNKAVQRMKTGEIDAMWVLAGFPTSALINLASTREITLLDIYTAGKLAGLYKKHPYYQPVKIPANIYHGLDSVTMSFYDTTLWIVGNHVSEDIVYQSLQEIFSEKGLKYLVAIKQKTAIQMSVQNGISGVNIPLHKGAQKFWQERGLKIPKKINAE